MWNVRLEGVVIIAQLQYALVPSVFYLGELLGQFEMSNVASHIFFFFALCSSLAFGVLNSIGSVVIDTLSSPPTLTHHGGLVPPPHPKTHIHRQHQRVEG